MNAPELVAPAGSYEALVVAFDQGADAVYAGLGGHNLRVHAPNLSIEELAQGIEYAHGRRKRLYLVLNSMPTDRRLGEIAEVLHAVARFGEHPDAVIVSDPGVLELCREHLRGVALHLSTQTGTFNVRAANFWRRSGIDRIVVPRELDLEQIAWLCGEGIPCEAFVHGAMCVSISGRCLLGAYLAGRHANYGDCPQPCRYRYRIVPEGGIEGFEVEEGEQGAYILNARDLCTVGILDRVVAAGVAALKIEGRNKSAHYVSAVVKTYRAALDRVLEHPGRYRPDSAWIEELERLDHRPYTTGFYTGEYRLQETERSKAAARLRLVGVVKAALDGRRVVVDVKNPFVAGEALEVLSVNRNRSAFTTKLTGLADLDGGAVERAQTNRLVVAEADRRLAVGDMMRRVNGAALDSG